MLPFPVPDGVGTHHDALLVTVQLVLEVTVKAVEPAGGVTFWLGGDTISMTSAVNVISFP